VKDFSEEMWARTKDYIPDEMNNFYIEKGALPWKARGLNPRIRFCRYEVGQHFSAHKDGYFQPSIEEQSLITFMVYLNGGFEGGATNFLDEEKTNDANNVVVLKKLNPEAGMLLVFQHDMLHEGEILRSGNKYMLRTEVVYRRQEPVLKDSPEQIARVMIYQAEQLEMNGNAEAAVQMYKKAYKTWPPLDPLN